MMTEDDRTDFDRLLQTLQSMMLPESICVKVETTGKRPVKIIEIDQGDGYSGFSCVFVFDKDGKFRSHGCWE